MFRLRTFGGVAIEGESGPISGRTSLRRRLALLALLAAARDRGTPREKLLAYLWPERDEEHGRHALSQLLHAVRRDFGAEAIVVGVDDLRLSRSHVWTDTGAFEDAISQGDFEAAVALYAGPFLDGFFLSDALEFEHWAEEQRGLYARQCASALESLAVAASRRGDHASAVATWRRRLVTEPLNSRVTLELMRALALAGDRAGAIQQGRIHASLLQQELGVAPDREIAAFMERIRVDVMRPLASIRPQDSEVESAARIPNGQAEDKRQIGASSPQAGDATAAEPVASETLPSSPRLYRWSKRWTPVLTHHGRRVTATLLLLGLGSVAMFRPIERALRSVRRAPRMVVIGAIRGTDRALALAVGEAVRAELEAAPGLRVASDGRLAAARQLMKIESDSALPDSLAAQVAARVGAPFAVAATAEPLGAGAEIVVRLLDSRDGTTISTLAEHPASPEEIVPAVSRLAEALRERALDIQVPDSVQALPAVTTASVIALRDYALARQAIAKSDNERAISYAEAAVMEDSAFALAHYLLGDLLWFVDRQHRSDEHLERAFALSNRLPLRERLIVRARYEQLVRDRPDSALAYWKLLRTTYPDEPRAYEGMSWVYTALGQPSLADAAADTASQLDATIGIRGVRAHIARLLAVGDTTGALTFARSNGQSVLFGLKHTLALGRGNWNDVLRLLDSAEVYGFRRGTAGALRQVAYLALGRLGDGERALDDVRADPRAQYLPRALLLQARAEATEGARSRAVALTRESLEWVQGADLSPPAYARLAERIADAAARSGDMATLAAIRRFIVTQDGGRNLRSYTLALFTIDAFSAFARGDMRSAFSFAQRTRGPMFYGRPVAITMQLEADAAAAIGQRQHADSIYRLLANPVGSFTDGDGETTAIVRRAAARILATGSQKTVR